MQSQIRSLIFFLALGVGLTALAQEKFQPALAGPWHTLFAPKVAGDYVNDHTLFQDPQGNWHLIGITSPGQSWMGLDERHFAHGISPALDQEMTELEPLFSGTPDHRRKWAPHVIQAQGIYHMFAGPGAIRHFTSADGLDWKYEGIAIAKPWWGVRQIWWLGANLDRGRPPCLPFWGQPQGVAPTPNRHHHQICRTPNLS